MKPDFLTEAKRLSADICRVRASIHRFPELGNREFKTAETVEAFLHDCGIETVRLTETAVMGILRGAGGGKTVALRADMDALPICEQTGADFASETEGVMHACGHDVHTAALLGAAKLLSLYRERFCGEVRFLFEPDEEGSGGAERMIAAGALQGVNAVFGAHVSPELPVGKVGVRFGKFYAASDVFTVTVHGKSAHGAEPEKGIDALSAAAQMIPHLKALPETRGGDRAVLSVGSFHAGTAGNIIADKAEFSGIIRTLGRENRAAMKDAFRKTVHDIAKKCGATAEILLRESYGGVVNADAETEFVRRTAVDCLGADAVCILDTPTMTTEDFGCFLDVVPGSFYHIGAGCTAPLHSQEFLPSDDALLTAAALHAAVAYAFLTE